MLYEDLFLNFVSPLAILFFYVISFAFIIWMIIDSGKQDKFWWLFLIIALPLLGAVIYYFVEKREDYLKVCAERCVHCKKGSVCYVHFKKINLK